MGTANPFTLLKESLRIRLFALLILLILSISVAFTIFHFRSESASLTSRSVVEGELLARLLARNSRLAVFAEHGEMLREAAEGILQGENVISADVFTADGKLLIHRTRSPREDLSLQQEGFPPAVFIEPLLRGKEKSLHREKGDYFEFFALVTAGPGTSSSESLFFSNASPGRPDRVIGIVRVVLDKKALNARLHALLVTTVVMVVLFLLLASLGAFLIAQGLTRSLRNLMKGVTTLEHGDLSGRIAVASQDELGKVSHAFNTMAEALERREREKRALEEQLRIAREKLAKEEWERTFDTVPDQIAILDPEYRITRINEAMADLLGVSKEQAAGTLLFEYFDGNGSPPYSARIAEYLFAGTTFSAEIYKERLDRFFFVTISPLTGANGMKGAVYVARDITERKKAMETLRVSEERFRIIADTIVEVIWMTDVNFTEILYVSPAYELVWGRSPEELYAAPGTLIDTIHPDDREEFQAILKSQLTGKPYETEYRIVRPDGSFRWIWDRGYPVHDGEGKVTNYTGVAEDITQKKQAEEEKQAIQAKLVQTNKMTSLGLLVSGLAHEVNNPNSSIKLAAHILSRSWDDISPILEKYYEEEGDFPISGQPFSQMKETMPQHIAGITANSRRIEGIIKNLRDFAQKGVSNLTYVVDVNTVISLSASILNPQLKQHTRHFKLALAEDLPPVKGNPQQIEQVVINLIMNAIQSLPDRNCKILVASSFDVNSDSVIIKVEDEGVGMPKEVRDRICEPFFSTKLDRGGSGLGLAISNFIIKEHKGTLAFDSEPGRGTTAIVTLPAMPGR